MIIIFDADNTLYDINPSSAYEEEFNYLSKKTNISAEKLKNKWNEIINEIKNNREPYKRTREYSTELLLKEFNIENKKLIEEALDVFWKVLYTKGLTEKPGVKEVIKELKEKNNKLIIASDEFEEFLSKKLNIVLGNWKEYFDFLVTPEVAESVKPSRKYYEIILNKTKEIPNNIVMVGDSWKRDLEKAKELGIKTILLSEEKKGNPDYHIKKLKELLEVLK